MERVLQILLLLLFTVTATAQEPIFLAHMHFRIKVEPVQEEVLSILEYDRFHGYLGGDTLRWCGEGLCQGWVVDRYSNGAMKHRGFYEMGRLMYYRNFFPSGQVERVFRVLNGRRSTLLTYDQYGNMRTGARFLNGTMVAYQDYHTNGRLRYFEEKHPTEPYYLRLGSYRSNSEPISLMRIVDRRKVEYVMREFQEGGVVGAEGPLRYYPERVSTLRNGVWRIYDQRGRLLRREYYVSGDLQQQ